MSVEPLDLDTDPKAYLTLHGLLDEPAADAGLTEREREVRTITREVVAREVALTPLIWTGRTASPTRACRRWPGPT
jgi:hypothetical protein